MCSLPANGTYSGEVIEWEDARNSDLSILPESDGWEIDPPVLPDA